MKSLINQYVGAGAILPEYQVSKLSNNSLNSYLRRRLQESIHPSYSNVLRVYEFIKLNGEGQKKYLTPTSNLELKIKPLFVDIYKRNRDWNQIYGFIRNIISLVKDKLDNNVVGILLEQRLISEHKFIIVQQIIPLVKDNWSSIIIDRILYNTPDKYKLKIVKQILPLVKDKLDNIMVSNLLTNYDFYWSLQQENRLEIAKQIISLVKHNVINLINMSGNILYFVENNENKLEIVKQIIGVVKDKLDYDIVDTLLSSTPEENKLEIVKQMLPLVKDKLGNNNMKSYYMVRALLSNTPKENKLDLVKQILPLFKGKDVDDNMVRTFFYSPLINLISLSSFEKLISKYQKK